MKPCKKLLKVQKKIQKAQAKCDKLKAEERVVQEEICLKEKKKASKERALFIKNVQVSKVEPFLKRKWSVLEEADRSAREMLFSMKDLVLEITAHLGPMEYSILLRTSKSIRIAVIPTVYEWAYRFFARFSQETTQPKERIEKIRYALLKPLQQYLPLNPHDAGIYGVLSLMLSNIHVIFSSYRPHGEFDFEVCDFNPRIIIEDWLARDELIFFYNKETGEVTRASNHNILFSTQSMTPSWHILMRRFKEKHGFGIEQEEKCGVDYFGYDEWNRLNLCEARRLKNPKQPRHCYLVEPERNLITPLECSPYEVYWRADQFIVKRGNWPGSLLVDEYECRLLVESAAKQNYSHK